jgi:hypothetical protein
MLLRPSSQLAIGVGALVEKPLILVRVVASHFDAGFETDGVVRHAAPSAAVLPKM